ncbi:MAG TPA: HAD-IA family hydrolase [Opitutales bacterium]|nr:HAD-IA family hydrolase [Opitutales bacterium]
MVFDLFHTLTARESTWSAGPMTYAMLGVPREAWERQLFETSRARLTGLEREPRKIVEGLARAINPGIEDSVIERAVANRLTRFAGSLTHIPPANLSVLTKLRRAGRKLGLISNADASEIQAWPQSPLREHFHSAVFSCEVGLLKPEPPIYLHCLEALGLPASECVYVADGSVGELTAARALGFTTVMIAGVIREIWPEKIAGRAREADFMIEELTELLPE